ESEESSSSSESSSSEAEAEEGSGSSEEEEKEEVKGKKDPKEVYPITDIRRWMKPGSIWVYLESEEKKNELKKKAELDAAMEAVKRARKASEREYEEEKKKKAEREEYEKKVKQKTMQQLEEFIQKQKKEREEKKKGKEKVKKAEAEKSEEESEDAPAKDESESEPEPEEPESAEETDDEEEEEEDEEEGGSEEEEKKEKTKGKAEKTKTKPEKAAEGKAKASGEEPTSKKRKKDAKDDESKNKKKKEKKTKEADESEDEAKETKSGKKDKKSMAAEPETEEEEKTDQKKSKKEKKEKKKKAAESSDEEDSEPKALKDAEAKIEDNAKGGEINSSSKRKEYMRFSRWCKNKKRFPTKLVAAINSSEGRAKLFEEYVKCDGDVSQILLRHEQSLREATRSELKWGFRGEKWLVDRHGQKKADKLMEKKRALGLHIQDPELPDDKDERLFFTLISLDVANISEFSRLTRLEMEGQIDEEGLREFVKGGGVLDPNSGLKITDFAGAIGADKLMSTMAIAPETKRKNKRKGKGEEEQRKSDDDVKEAFIHFIHTETVVPETPLQKATSLLTKVLKDVSDCRTQAFRLQPIKMSNDLISQLQAAAVKLETLAHKLQDLIKKGKNKTKHYREIMLEVDKTTKIARERMELGKALVRASEKAANPKPKQKASPKQREPKEEA
ncbi:unnamed protein product, partial [Durusdinium trenchii]